MREPPANLVDATLFTGLDQSYGISADRLHFLPFGHDSSAWVYEVRAGAERLFLKVRRSVTNPASLLVPRHLHDHGVTRVVAPLPTREGRLWASAGTYDMIVYPFIDAVRAMEHGMTGEQWQTYGQIFRQIHHVPVPANLAGSMRRETFTPYTADWVRQIDAYLAAERLTDPISNEVALVWQEHREQIWTALERAETLGRRLAAANLPLVLCHADCHTGNILLDAHGALWVVDWDETMLAPKERDLMFAMGGGIYRGWVSAANERDFLAGYHDADIDPLALSYYRYAWAVAEFGEYGSAALFRDDLGEVTRRESVQGLRNQFVPGAIVEIAFNSDDQA